MLWVQFYRRELQNRNISGGQCYSKDKCLPVDKLSPLNSTKQISRGML